MNQFPLLFRAREEMAIARPTSIGKEQKREKGERRGEWPRQYFISALPPSAAMLSVGSVLTVFYKRRRLRRREAATSPMGLLPSWSFDAYFLFPRRCGGAAPPYMDTARERFKPVYSDGRLRF